MLEKAARRMEVAPETILSVDVAGVPVALYNIEGEVLATSDVCPHAYCRLSENADIVNGDEVECSCHGSRFSIRTGDNLNPPSADPLPTYQVSVEDDDVFVDIG
jgi:nitrite reductase/ring-hydroxylating ferredoxin subunit